MEIFFSCHCKEILEKAEEAGKRYGSIGSEILLLSFLRNNNSTCTTILNSHGLNEFMWERQLEDLIILRKERSFTKGFSKIKQRAFEIAKQEGSKNVYEEHLLYSLLTTGPSVALYMLELNNIEIHALIEDINNIYCFEQTTNTDKQFLVNITKLAKLDQLNPFIGRVQIIDKIIRILSKKQKNNPMLIGSAGVGKTALVEGVTLSFLEINPSINIYRLDLGTVIAGTKYRGDLEERMLSVIMRIKNVNSIVFIDEIHNIVGSGSSEGTLDIANILKPILARSEIKCIGATTLDEYYRYIEKDRALARRFQNVFVDETSPDEAYEIIEGIAPGYESYHDVKYNKKILRYIIESSALITHRKLPDKAIDILDEAGLLCRLDERRLVKRADVDQIIYENLGINYEVAKNCVSKIKNYHNLAKYYRQYFMNLGIRKTIMNIQTTEEYLDLLIEDLNEVFSLKSESILTIDLSKFTETHFSSSLVGSPAGYVGYEDGGLLTEHVLKFPLSIIILKNPEVCNGLIMGQINSILQEGKIRDSKGRIVSFSNCFFFFIVEDKNNVIGFINKERKIKKISPLIDEIINFGCASSYYRKKINVILKKMKAFNYKVSVDVDVLDYSLYCNLLNELSDFDNFKPKVKYSYRLGKNKSLEKIKK